MVARAINGANSSIATPAGTDAVNSPTASSPTAAQNTNPAIDLILPRPAVLARLVSSRRKRLCGGPAAAPGGAGIAPGHTDLPGGRADRPASRPAPAGGGLANNADSRARC
jgi:hypothetical protein